MNTPIFEQSLHSPRTLAKFLYWQGWRVSAIAEYLQENSNTVYSWKERDKWDDATALDRVEGAFEWRLVMLAMKEKKEAHEFKEIDLLMRQMERRARIDKYGESGKETDLNPKIRARNEAPRKAKNDVGQEGVELLINEFKSRMFDYQKDWYRAGLVHRIRNILKSRQIGATYYLALEAICDAVETGKNKIFLSASKAQAHVFKNYIIQFVKEITGVELKGDPIVLANGAQLHFLGTNARTAQGYHGDIYMDEYFWINNFQEFRKVASGMAMHKQWKQTYSSTPSAITHEAYPFWTGDLFNKRRKSSEKVTIDVSHEALKKGVLCADNQWRQIITVDDAVSRGCNLFDLDALRLEYSEDEFNNLMLCQFVDDSLSVFPMIKLQACMVDSWLAWRDFKPFTPRPLGDKEAWIGHDPDGGGEDGDGAGLVVLSPGSSTSPHRIIEKRRLRGMDYEQQAAEIEKLTKKYSVRYIDIDGTGLGEAVAKMVRKFFPAVRVHTFSVDSKAQLVLKAQHVVDRGRLQFDSGDTDLAQSFMAIRRTLTASSRQMTYVAGRRAGTGHADLAWATMLALSNEPLEGPTQGTHSGSFLEIY